jgi:hypothetical protein
MAAEGIRTAGLPCLAEQDRRYLPGWPTVQELDPYFLSGKHAGPALGPERICAEHRRGNRCWQRRLHSEDDVFDVNTGEIVFGLGDVVLHVSYAVAQLA